MKTLAETVVTSTLGVLLAGSLVQFNVSTLWATDKTFAADTLTRAGRSGLDEVLYQTRNASVILGEATVNGTALRTSATTLILRAPSFDATASDFRISGQTDTIVFRFDSGAKALKETIVKGAGTSRPSRTNFVIARNVTSFNVRYQVRDSFTAPASGSTTSYTLTQTPTSGSTPTVLIDGVPTSATTSGATLTITGSAPPAGANVQVFYPVTPTASGANPVVSAVGITVTLEMSAAGGKRTSQQTWAIDGTARLRNLRS